MGDVDPGDIENDEIAHEDSTGSDSAPDALTDATDATEATDPTEATDAPIGHPEGYEAPVDAPAPVYHPDRPDTDDAADTPQEE